MQSEAEYLAGSDQLKGAVRSPRYDTSDCMVTAKNCPKAV